MTGSELTTATRRPLLPLRCKRKSHSGRPKRREYRMCRTVYTALPRNRLAMRDALPLSQHRPQQWRIRR